MNNRKHRRWEKQAQKKAKKEPVLMMKPSQIVNTAVNMERQKMEQEIYKQCLEADKRLTKDMDTVVLWTLHNVYGWGPKRLRDFYLAMLKEHLRMREFYELEDLYPERMKLREIGVDLDAWYDEIFNDDGTVKIDL